MKPLGHKAYGHIPHLHGSRMTPSDKHCEFGQQKIATEKKRDKHDLIIVQEKLDGSNCSVAKINNEIVALTRSGYLAETSKYIQHHYFSKWVEKNKDRFNAVLQDGERIVGEWLLQACGTRYNLPHEPFVVFDIMLKNERIVYDFFYERVKNYFKLPKLIHKGIPISINEVLEKLEPSGHGAIDMVEGAIWRVERKNKVDFLCKYVRPEKKDGIYLPEISGKEAIWNINPDSL